MKTTFPPHGMAGTPGAERVGDLGNVPIDYVEIDEVDLAELRKLVQKDQFHIVIRKQSLNVFDNPNTHKLVDLIRPEHVSRSASPWIAACTMCSASFPSTRE